MWRSASLKWSRAWPWCPADVVPCTTTARVKWSFITAVRPGTSAVQPPTRAISRRSRRSRWRLPWLPPAPTCSVTYCCGVTLSVAWWTLLQNLSHSQCDSINRSANNCAKCAGTGLIETQAGKIEKSRKNKKLKMMVWWRDGRGGEGCTFFVEKNKTQNTNEKNEKKNN